MFERQVSYIFFTLIRVLAILIHVLKMVKGKCVSLAKKRETYQTETIMGEALRLNELISAKLINTSSSKKMNQVKRPQDYFNPKHIQMKCMLTHACLFVQRASSIQTLTEVGK